MKACRLCGQEKPLSEFHKAKQCVDGHRGECKKCFSRQQLERARTPNGRAKRAATYQKNKDRWNAIRSSPEGQKRFRNRVKSTPSYVLSYALYRALKRRPSDNPVTHTQLMRIYEEQGGCCALSGIKMTWMEGKIKPTSISIDRIDSAKGYTFDNVRLLCHSVNRMKGDATDEEMFQIAFAIVENLKKPKLRLVS